MGGRVGIAVMLVVAAACCWLAPGAGAADGRFIYWSHGTTVSPQGIGRANIDGTGVDESFITGTSEARGIAVNDEFIYWANRGSIGRANLDGTGVDQNAIANVVNPFGQAVAVDGSHVYWTAIDTTNKGLIGRANLDGSGRDDSFISYSGASGGDPQGVAVDGQHIWWSDSSGVIGRANIDGTGVQPNFIDAGLDPRGVAASGGYVYWTNSRGVGVWNNDQLYYRNLTLIADPLARFFFVAADGQSVYWTNGRAGIGRSSFDATVANYSLISGVTQPQGVAVTPPPAPTCAGREATIFGDAGDNRLSGTTAADVIAGGKGDDRIRGADGDDVICAGSGDDRLAGGPGRDHLRGGPGRDTLLGGTGRDRLIGGPGKDRKVP